MGRPRQKSCPLHDPLGLLALPMTSNGVDRPANDGPQPGSNNTTSFGVVIPAKTIGGALVAVLIVVSLVALPGPAKDLRTIPHCRLERG
jgi:hypothetical protein